MLVFIKIKYNFNDKFSNWLRFVHWDILHLDVLSVLSNHEKKFSIWLRTKNYIEKHGKFEIL